MMRKKVTIKIIGMLLTSLVFFINNTYSQSATCDQIEPFCAGGASLVFQNTTGGSSAENGPDYDCLTTTPNPAWFYLRIDTGGNLNFTISQNTNHDFTGAGLDVDFICYGPFTNPDNCNNLTTANIVACSYSPDAVESFSIPNANPGEVYVLLITNFDGNSGWIQLEQTNTNENGAGSTDCSVIASLGEDIEFCGTGSVTLDGTAQGVTSYRWFVDVGAGFNPIPGETNPTLVVTTTGNYRVEVSDGVISDTDDVMVNFYDLPVVVSPITLEQCDDDTDGITAFNLTEIESLLTNDSPVTFTYHLTRADAEAGVGLITDLTNFSNSVATQVFVRVKNEHDCISVAELNLRVSTTAIPQDFRVEFSECDTDADGDDTNGITTFNFSSATQTILNLFPANQILSVTYYETIADALAEQNALDATNFRNSNSPYNQELVVRVDSQSNNACVGLGFHISLTVNPLPEFELPDPQYLCSNLLPETAIITVENPQDNYTYEWRDATGVLISPSSSSPELAVNTLGDYFVTATTIHNCMRTKKVSVVTSNTATIESIDVVDDSDNNTLTIHVTGDGDYEYALDNIDGPYQDSNHFENVFAGIRTVYVRDKRGCGIVSKEASVIGFPRFFTPNGDGINDTWQVLGIDFQLDSKIYIYDRFGKVITKILPNSEGWDGTFRGKKMPSADYWFTVKLEDGRFRRGHFSLVRR